MQVVKQNKLDHIERALRSSEGILVMAKKYSSGLQDALKENLKEYTSLVRISLAPKQNAPNVKELLAIRDSLVKKIGLAPSVAPTIVFTKFSGRSTFGVTRARIEYSEEVLGGEVKAAHTNVNGSRRDILLVIYPSQEMALPYILASDLTPNNMMQNALSMDGDHIKKLHLAAGAFKITQKERIKYDIANLQRE